MVRLLAKQDTQAFIYVQKLVKSFKEKHNSLQDYLS